jgi:ketosteroid isomerase-like protein
MSPKLETWRIEVKDVCVDEGKKSAVVRADFHMQAKGDPEAVLNEIVFWVYMNETGEKVVKSTEFVDPAATGELMKRMKAAQASSEQS